MRLPLLITAAVLALPATAAAAPPPNDNYLASTTISTAEYRDTVDTTEATTQADTFNPNRDGLPFAGGDPEPTSCGGTSPFGKTAWWDFKAPSAGGVEIKANGGFDVVVAVYTWSERTSKITRTLRCQNDEAGSEDLVIPRVSAGTNYTIQVGGANNAGGPLNLEFTYFPDTDGDGILDDAPDDCRRVPGSRASAAARPSCAPPRACSTRPSAARCASPASRSTTCPRARAPRSAAGARSSSARSARARCGSAAATAG
jgi:hypothetical protein